MIAELDRVVPGIEDLEENEIRPCVEHLELRDGHEPFGQRLGFLDALYAGLLVINLVLEAKPEKFLGQVRVNQSIEIGVATYSGRKFQGKVFFISPYVDLTNRTALVKAEVPNPSGDLKPGMFANLNLTVTIRENAVVIPEVALTQTLEKGRAMVFVVDANTNAQLRPIKLGVRLAGQVEVEGIQAGERVIVEGTQKTVPGKPVQLAPEKEAEIYQPRNTVTNVTNTAAKS